ncbi:MAG TPA: TlpA disulfide reductase family protein [Pseudonocardiaceae bacterium]|jgi:thiol-disulfide isomerase/thioredoxin|nr:TlpA disulfide reductase family protein [Pseudonocardiaceae bacterium]
MRRWAILPALALAALALAGCGAGKNAVNTDADYNFVSPGGQFEFFYDSAQRKPLQDLAGTSLQQPNQQIAISSFPNKVVVLNIWGAWCANCRAEAPELQQVYGQTKSMGVQLLGIDFKDQSRNAALDFMNDYQMNYPSIYDFAGRTLLELNNFPRSSVPTTIVLDREHRVAAVYLEQVNAAKLLPEITKVAEEKA